MDDGGIEGRRLRLLDGGAAAAARDEAALVGAWLRGDQAAFGALVARHQPLVLAIVRRYAASPEDARDLAQRTFLRAFEATRRALGGRAARDPEAGGVPFRRWLIRVAVNQARNHRRDERRRGRVADEATLAAVPAAGAGAPEALARAEAAARMRAAVLRLPSRQREVLTLRVDAELPFAEIAAALDVTENAAKVAFHHAMRRLRAEVAEGEEDRP
jgi:RNA polymerase sigma-70 factor (ECF subfamily)